MCMYIYVHMSYMCVCVCVFVVVLVTPYLNLKWVVKGRGVPGQVVGLWT